MKSLWFQVTKTHFILLQRKEVGIIKELNTGGNNPIRISPYRPGEKVSGDIVRLRPGLSCSLDPLDAASPPRTQLELVRWEGVPEAQGRCDKLLNLSKPWFPHL